MFNRSLLKVIDYQPYRTDAQGNVVQTLNGVFILLSQELVDILKEGLTADEKTELQDYVLVRTEAQCAEWHVPVWAGNDSAVYVRVPASVWNDPTTRPPAKVRRFFSRVYQEATD